MARFEVFTAVLSKILVVVDMTSYQLVNYFLCFGGDFCRHLQGVSSTKRNCLSPKNEGNNLCHKVNDYQLMQLHIAKDRIVIINSSMRTLFR
jgi:hypothetical protein